MYLSTKTQIRRMETTIQHLKNTLHKLESTDFIKKHFVLAAEKTDDDFMLAEHYLKLDKLQIEYGVQQIKGFDAEWQNSFFTTQRDESDVNAYFEMYFGENGILAALKEADDQLVNICLMKNYVFLQKSNGTFEILDNFGSMLNHVSIIPDPPKIHMPVKNQTVDYEIDKNSELVINSVSEDQPIRITASSTTINETSIDQPNSPYVIQENSELVKINHCFANAGQHATVNIVISSTVTTAPISCNIKISDCSVVGQKPVSAAYNLDLITDFIAKFESAFHPGDHKYVRFSLAWERKAQYACTFTDDFLQVPEIAQLVLLAMLRLMFTCTTTTFGCSVMPVQHSIMIIIPYSSHSNAKPDTM